MFSFFGCRVATVGFSVLTANNNDLNLVETRTVHFTRQLNLRLVLIEQTELLLDRDYSYAIDPKARAKMPGIVNKLGLLQQLMFIPEELK